jgi:hypothetical protein
MSKKYDALGQFLKTHSSDSIVPLTFAEIEEIIGSKLPPSAYEHRPWWSNNPSNNVMTKVWLAADFETEQVDMTGRKLVFRNVGKMMHEFDEIAREQGFDLTTLANGLAEEPREFRGTVSKQPRRHPAFGALKGTFTIEPGWDLTKPAMDTDELAEWEANQDRQADMIEQGMKGKRP